jgi:hypothetical protein
MAERLTTVVSWRSLGEATRQAFRELLLWVESSFELTREDAAMLLAMVAEPRVCQVCNALPTARCSVVSVVPSSNTIGSSKRFDQPLFAIGLQSSQAARWLVCWWLTAGRHGAAA